MTWTLEGKKVLVTGASSGIGAALAEGFAARGATVGICARREDRLAEVLERCRAHAPGSRMWTVDLADLDGIAGFARRAEADLGGVDVLVNNAGIPKRRHTKDLTGEVVEDVMRINFFSPVRLTLALLPGLIERQGRIVNISSVAARLGPPGEAAYAASKGALTVWSESTFCDLADLGVRVHVVDPGVIDTDLFHLPDNDPFEVDVERLPTDVMVEPVVRMLEEGTFELVVPDSFAPILARKAADVGAFLENSVAWSRAKAAGTTA